MLEFVRIPVGTPIPFPSTCICGRGVDKHLLDTHMEIAGQHVYLCKLCVSRAARVFGLVEGDEMEKLSNAGAELDQAQKEIEDRNALITRQTEELAARARRVSALEELVRGYQDRELTQKNMIGILKENTRELESVVGGG